MRTNPGRHALLYWSAKTETSIKKVKEHTEIPQDTWQILRQASLPLWNGRHPGRRSFIDPTRGNQNGSKKKRQSEEDRSAGTLSAEDYADMAEFLTLQQVLERCHRLSTRNRGLIRGFH